MTDRARLMAALLTAYVLGWMGALFGLPDQPEHELQLFLSDHYRRQALELWEPRWHGGFSMAFHPPAFHELIGLFGRVVGVERSYAVLVALLPVLMTIAMAAAVWQRTNDRRAACTAAWAMAAQPLLYAFVFPWGQTPLVFACALALSAGAALTFGLREMSVTALAASAALLVLVATSHPVAIIVALAFIAAALRDVLHGSSKQQLAWFAVVALSGLASLLSLIPFVDTVKELLSSHSRVALAPADKWLFIAALAFTWAWRWAAFDPRVALALCTLGCVWVVGSQGTSSGERRFQKPLREALEYINAEPDAWQFRYLTVGLRRERLQLGRNTAARTLDGGVSTLVRQVAGDELPTINLDALDHDDVEHRRWLERVVAGDPHLRWLITSDPRLKALAESSALVVRNAWGAGVVLWERRAAEPMAPNPTSVRSLPFIAIPLLAYFVLGLLIAARSVAYLGSAQRRGQWLWANESS